MELTSTRVDKPSIGAARERAGRFLILGSVPALMTQVFESLAGRLQVLELAPFVLWEVAGKTVDDH